MTNQVQVITEAENIEGLGSIVRCDAPFDKALEALGSKEIITAKQLAYARIKAGKEHSLSQDGSYIREGSLYIPNAQHKRILLRDSLVLQNPAAATEAHRQSKEYFPAELPDAKAVDAYLEKLAKGSYFVIDDLSRVPVERFGEDERMVWLFGEHAEDYGLFLKEAGVISTGFFLNTGNDQYVDAQKAPFANQLWLNGIDDDSNVYGDSRLLDFSYRVRRVAQKNFPSEMKVQETQPKGIVLPHSPQIVAPTLEQMLAVSEGYVPARLKSEYADAIAGLYKK